MKKSKFLSILLVFVIMFSSFVQAEEVLNNKTNDDFKEYLLYDIKVFKAFYHKDKVKNIKFLLKKQRYNLYIYDEDDLEMFLNILEKRMEHEKS